MRKLFVMALLVIAAEEISACSCAGPIGPEEAFADATHVFEGKVVAFDDQYTALRKAWDAVEEKLGRKPDWNAWERTHGFKAVFEVTKVWKGTLKKRFVLYTGRGAGDCGYRFKTGQVYLVYAYCNRPDCATDGCTRTAPRSQAGSDLRYLSTLPVRTP